MNDQTKINKIQNATPIAYKKFVQAIQEYIQLQKLDKK